MRTRFIHRGRLLLAIITASFMVTLPARAAAPLVNATLEPSQIALGESAQLTITSSNNRMEPPRLPEVPGLELRFVGQSQRIQLVNGVTLASSSFIVRVTPQTAGVFTIPGVTPNGEPLVLRVTPAGSPAPDPWGLSGGAGLPVGVTRSTSGSPAPPDRPQGSGASGTASRANGIR